MERRSVRKLSRDAARNDVGEWQFRATFLPFRGNAVEETAAPVGGALTMLRCSSARRGAHPDTRRLERFFQPMKLISWFVFSVLPLAFLLTSWQAMLPPAGLATTRSTGEQARDLLRQQIETWKTPPVELTPDEELETSISPTETTPTIQPAPTSTETPPTPQRLSQSGRPKLVVRKTRLRSAALLARFYEAREYRLAWSTEDELLPVATELLDAIHSQAEREGLRTSVYRLEKTRQFLREIQQQGVSYGALDPSALADLDLLLTDIFFLYSAHLSTGTPRFDALDAQWFEDRHKVDVVLALQQALEANRIVDALNDLTPRYPEYGKLREALQQYREIAARGGWPSIPPGFDLRPGDHDERIFNVRARLRVTGEFTPPSTERTASAKRAKGQKAQISNPERNTTYDPALVQAVKKFQKRMGLAVDGVIGGRTWAALNVPVETRIRQIIANMDRWRELPSTLGNRYIAVNIPNFTLDVVEYGQSALHMKVVVGKMVGNRNTPTFSAEMTYLVLNPYWYVPRSIAENELFPLAKNDPDYFAKHNFVVHRVAVGEKQVPAPSATDGALISKPIYQYRLKQAPGPKNALGRVKFIFPNSHGVYLHDTPSKDFFKRSVRTYSHGCIRVEKPIELAEYLLQGASEWTKDAILETIARKKEKKVVLPEAIPVYIQYWTAWVDAEGVVQFRNDIYGYDNVPGARLPVSPPANPRPQPEPQPVLQEAQPTPQNVAPDPLVLQPIPQSPSHRSTLLESSSSAPSPEPLIVQ